MISERAATTLQETGKVRLIGTTVAELLVVLENLGLNPNRVAIVDAELMVRRQPPQPGEPEGGHL